MVIWVHNKRVRTLSLWLLAVVSVAALLLAAKPAHAQFHLVYTVNSTGDEPDANAGDNLCDVDTSTPGQQCTLRAAIQDANANGTTNEDFIDFNIGGSGVKVISPATLLPIIRQPVIIDGYTQTGATENTLAVGDDANLLIRLDRGSGSAGSGLWIDTNDSVVRGLSITGFSSGAGVIVAGDNNTVEGNFIGTDPGGIQAGVGNFTGVIVQSDSSNNLVGGTLPEARNVISGNGGEGVRINTNPGEKGNRVQGNYIGTTKSGTADLGNTSAGVIDNSFGDSENLIGGTSRAAANTIAFNGRDGVQVGDGFVPVGISILRNSIFSNGGLGIDLIGSGESLTTDVPTPNDGGVADDADTGPNGLQNKPVLTAAITSSGTTTIRGVLDTKPNTTYRVQFFSQPTGNEGRKFIGQKLVPTDADGRVPFTFSPVNAVAVGQLITATATGPEGTSEFSGFRQVTAS